jgi:osmotically-inducible protein OsmY
MAEMGTIPQAQGKGGGLGGALRAISEVLAMLRGGDHAIAARVSKATRAVPGVPSKGVGVESWRGHVSLRGDVPSKEIASAVAQAASAVRGVTSIDNFLRTP